ncbi:MAG: hypothetical protein J1F36_05195 [Clostridiales bacterium]|nr:hypothetical protein [Clostridiales bacterium]
MLQVFYIERSTECNWKISIEMNIGNNTLDHWRSEIIKWFEYYCRKVSS